METHPKLPELMEVVMDLGHPQLACFPSGDFLLSHRPISFDNLRHATSQVGDFGADNRAGISLCSSIMASSPSSCEQMNKRSFGSSIMQGGNKEIGRIEAIAHVTSERNKRDQTETLLRPEENLLHPKVENDMQRFKSELHALEQQKIVKNILIIIFDNDSIYCYL